MFQAWWATHASVRETSTRYSHAPGGISPQGSSPGLWELRAAGNQGPNWVSVPTPTQLAGRAPRQGARGAADPSLRGPGPQVLLRLGRQRWKLRGRIESDDSQTWDEEEKAFIPTLHENFEIKVGGA